MLIGFLANGPYGLLLYPLFFLRKFLLRFELKTFLNLLNPYWNRLLLNLLNAFLNLLLPFLIFSFCLSRVSIRIFLSSSLIFLTSFSVMFSTAKIISSLGKRRSTFASGFFSFTLGAMVVKIFFWNKFLSI